MGRAKIQTGLRVPEELYERIAEMAVRSGASINSIILMLMDIGLKALDAGAEAAAREIARNRSRTSG